MKSIILALLLGSSASAFAIGTSMKPITQTPTWATEELIVRVGDHTGLVELSADGGQKWVVAESFVQDDAKVEKAQYYVQSPCGTTVYADPCGSPCATECGAPLAVPGYGAYVAPQVYEYDYYAAPAVPVYPRAYTYGGGYRYYNYVRPRAVYPRAYTYPRHHRRRW